MPTCLPYKNSRFLLISRLFITATVMLTSFPGWISATSPRSQSMHVSSLTVDSQPPVHEGVLEDIAEPVSRVQVQEISIGQQEITPVPNVPRTSRQIDDHTWTVSVGEDPYFASPKEIFYALNDYRRQKGKALLMWDAGLADYAQHRADSFALQSALDEHRGFQAFLSEHNGFHLLGYGSVGENSSFGYKLEGEHLIEWVYAGDTLHDSNQLNSKWTHVGVGVNGRATDLIFAGNKF